MKLIRRMRPEGRPIWILICATVLAVGVASVASGAAGDFVRVGKRNAAAGTTAIVGSTTNYATRQSNNQNGDGGAASYGCRSDAAHEACLLVLNHQDGRVFNFRSHGALSAGFIEVIPPSGKSAADVAPFTTNAKGVASGLNADEVDGQSAGDIVAAALPKLAQANAAGTQVTGRGLAQAGAVQKTGDGAYTVKFASDVSKCALTVTETTTTDAGAAAAAPHPGDVNAVDVVTRAGGGADGTGPTSPADRPFHLVVSC